MTPEMLKAQAERLAAEYAADNQNLEVSKKLADTYEQLDQHEVALQFYEWAFHLSSNDPALEKKVSALREKVGKAKLAEMKAFIEANPETS